MREREREEDGSNRPARGERDRRWVSVRERERKRERWGEFRVRLRA